MTTSERPRSNGGAQAGRPADRVPPGVRYYPDAAPGLWAAGYSPVPLPERAKKEPLKGWTGAQYRGVMASRADVQAWADDPKHARANTAARLPEEYVGLDVDAYDGKPGAQTWAALVAEHGTPPRTAVAWNRDDGASGIRLYRLPDGITEDQLGSGLPGIDVIRHGHRYITAPGSIHPEGRVYACRHEATGEALDTLPPVDSLPVLPVAWAQAFTKAHRTAQEAAEKHRALTPGQPCQAALTALGKALEALGSGESRHDAACKHVGRLLRLGDQGHAGIERALGDLQAEFVASVAAPREGSKVGARTTAEALREFRALVADGLGLIAREPTPDDKRGCCTPAAERAAVAAYVDGLPADSAEAGGEDDAAPSRGRRLALTPAAAIAPLRARWLWEMRLAVGTLAILAGREGVGKSTLAYWIAAQVTRGALPGELLGKPAAVLVVATEDSWAHTIVPRLIAAGADLALVYRVDVDTELGGSEVSLPADIVAVGEAAEATGAALLLLDPLMSRLSATLDTHKDAETRQALEPLTRMLDRTRMVGLGLMHFNKRGTDDPLTALMASRAFSAVARSVSTVVRDPDDEDGRRRLFGTPKNNLGPDNLPLLSFVLESFTVPTVEGDTTTSRIVWGEEVAESVADVLRRSHDTGDRTAMQEAADWLDDYLASQGGSADSAAIKRAGRGAGHSEDSLKRARKRLGVTSESHGFPRRTVWSLPEPSQGKTVGASPGETHLTALTALTETTAAQSVQSVQSVVPREDVPSLTAALLTRCEVCGLEAVTSPCSTCRRLTDTPPHRKEATA